MSPRILQSCSVDYCWTGWSDFGHFNSSQAFKTTWHIFEEPVVFLLNLSGQDAEEDEDEHPLEGIGDGEQVGSEGGLIEDVQHSQGPGGSQHEEQSQGTAGAGPDVFIVADFRLFHSSVPVHFVDDYSKSQEINQNDQTRRTDETPNEVVFCAQPTRLISAIILGAECCWDGHHHRRASVAKDIKVTVQEAFVVDYANHN